MPKSGYIYAIGVEGLPFVKIGMTKNHPENRLQSMQSGNPLRLYLIGSIRIEACLDDIERRIHAHLLALCERGEWFDIPLTAERLEQLTNKALEEYRATIKIVTRHTYSGRIGHDIKTIRMAHGLTQAAMAEILGYNTNYIARLERSNEQSTEDLMGSEKIADRLKKFFPEKKMPKPKKTS